MVANNQPPSLDLHNQKPFVADTPAPGMSRYPRSVRSSRVKCIGCNAPTSETIDGAYVCVECGEVVIGAQD